MMSNGLNHFSSNFEFPSSFTAWADTHTVVTTEDQWHAHSDFEERGRETEITQMMIRDKEQVAKANYYYLHARNIYYSFRTQLALLQP